MAPGAVVDLGDAARGLQQRQQRGGIGLLARRRGAQLGVERGGAGIDRGEVVAVERMAAQPQAGGQKMNDGGGEVQQAKLAIRCRPMPEPGERRQRNGQQQGLYDSYTGRRFLAYMAALKEMPRKAVAAEVDRVAAAVNLTAELDKRLSAYSGGMKQRLLLASALLGDPKLLILDEPTAGLDPKERVRLRELLADMAKDRIILVATHVVSDVETVATKVILLRAGKIVDAAPVPELIEKYAPGQGLEDVYLNVFGEGDGK